MGIKEAFKEAVKQVADKFYGPAEQELIAYDADWELRAAYDELRQRQQDFEYADERYIESALMYLDAAKKRVDELVRERRQ
jgi:cytochrome c556